ncbi:hypothetical protein BaRGS_00014521 [Batillaria attramentaria]|uniref:Uncharacterized protein n=1 Tax=Batillaria attramentaria TaxID=370345 RepID=A0ABD0L486_9CAEN
MKSLHVVTLLARENVFRHDTISVAPSVMGKREQESTSKGELSACHKEVITTQRPCVADPIKLSPRMLYALYRQWGNIHDYSS